MMIIINLLNNFNVYDVILTCILLVYYIFGNSQKMIIYTYFFNSRELLADYKQDITNGIDDMIIYLSIYDITIVV